MFRFVWTWPKISLIYRSVPLNSYVGMGGLFCKMDVRGVQDHYVRLALIPFRVVVCLCIS